MVGTTGLNQYSLGAALPPSGLRAARSLVIAFAIAEPLVRSASPL